VRRLLVLAALLLAGCQQAPVSHPPASSAVSPAHRLKAEGDALVAKADYRGAIEKYLQAIDLDAAAIGPRFGLGTAYSFLDKRQEAILQFRWVLDHAAPDSTEYREARRWLTRVGALAPPPAVADSAQPDATPDPSTTGRLVGKTEWPEITPQRFLVTGMLSLIGDEPVTQDVKRTRAFRLGDLYEFRGVPAGRYRVVAVIDETTIWDQKVTVEAGKDTNLTLSQSSSPVPASRFTPPPATASAAGGPDAARER
jgi:tetratricopeptide (TPR) repeat protein